MKPPDFDNRPLYTPSSRDAGDDGADWASVRYGTFCEFPSACFWVIDWGEDDEGMWFQPIETEHV